MFQNIERKVFSGHTVSLCYPLPRGAPATGSEEQVPASPAKSSQRARVALASNTALT